jgi:hypothetical protein
MTKKFFVARKHKFLFTPNQKIVKPIYHLRYTNSRFQYPIASDNPYHIPFDYFMEYNKNHPRKKKIMTPIISTSPIKILSTSSNNEEVVQPSSSTSSSTNTLPQTSTSRSYKVKDIENWIALPPEVERKLPKAYLPFVHNKPLHSRTKKRYYPPGTPKWYEHVKEAHRLDQIRKLAEQNRLKLQQDADYHGTSPKKYKKRKKTVKNLTDYQNRYHKAYSNKRVANQQAKPKKVVYERPRCGSDSATTSDNTKEIEYRPLKWNDTTEPRTHPSALMISQKKSRVLITGDDDRLDKEI